jgi:hypothetical protein
MSMPGYDDTGLCKLDYLDYDEHEGMIYNEYTDTWSWF